MISGEVEQAYVEILTEELVPAMGCTEPVAVAYAGALARRTLGKCPDEVVLVVSGNIIKNVKSVYVPHTGGRRGLRCAVAAGICYGQADRELEVLSDSTPEDQKKIDAWLAGARVDIRRSEAKCLFDIQLTAREDGDEAFVRIAGHHTNVVEIRRNQTVLVQEEFVDEEVTVPENRKLLTVENIIGFAESVELGRVRELLERQISCNMAIAREGMEGSYGAEIGKILIKAYGNSLHNRAKAWASAGSDARMAGCEMPVVINSHSGNQGLTASVPVIVYGREMKVPHDTLLRALIVSNLVTIHLKTGIGSLSAYCGATSAGAGAGAGICFLMGGRMEEISHTIVNTLAINSGMICDGAKPSCAAKIASAVEAGLLGMEMYRHDSQFYGGDGIVIKGVENTIDAVSKLARDGMRETDREVLSIMLGSDAAN